MGSLWPRRRRRRQCWCSATALSRIYLGVHSPVDVAVRRRVATVPSFESSSWSSSAVAATVVDGAGVRIGRGAVGGAAGVDVAVGGRQLLPLAAAQLRRYAIARR